MLPLSLFFPIYEHSFIMEKSLISKLNHELDLDDLGLLWFDIKKVLVRKILKFSTI